MRFVNGALVFVLLILINFSLAQDAAFCNRLLDQYHNLSATAEWVPRMLDANAKIPSGLYSGNGQELGSFDQCISISSRYNQTAFYGKYCLATVKTPSFNFRWGACIPSPCNFSNVTIEINLDVLQFVLNSSYIEVVSDETDCQTKETIHPEFTTGAIVTLVLLSLYIACIFVATCIEAYKLHKQEKVPPLCFAFSLIANVKRLFAKSTSQNHLHCIEGLRVISIVVIIFCHTLQVIWSGPLLNLGDIYNWMNAWHSQIILGSSVTVDTFLVITGLLVSYPFLSKNEKGKKFNIPQYYIRKYIRITPAYAVAILVVATLFPYLGTGPYWIFASQVQSPCKSYWWSSLLYIQNYYNPENLCITPSWYLDIYMQLIIISPIILIPLVRYRKCTLAFLGIVLIFSVAFPFYLSWHYELPAIIANPYGNTDLYFNKYYYITHARLAPWVIGLILGCIIFEIKMKRLELKITRLVNLCLWCVCFSVMFTSLIVGYDHLKGERYNYWGNALHISLIKPAWSIAISWMILACYCGYGGPINWFLSLPLFQLLGKQVFSVYIIHKPILYMLTYIKRNPFYFNFGNYLTEGGANTVYAFTVATPWVLLFEFPFAVLEYMLLNK